MAHLPFSNPASAHRTHTAASSRAGVTITECVIATTLLATALMTMGLVHQRIAHGIARVRTIDAARTALSNARAEIGSWPTNQLTIERIRTIAMPRELSDMATSAQWSARIDPWRPDNETQTSAIAQRVQLTLQWHEAHNPDAPLHQSLTFWVQP